MVEVMVVLFIVGVLVALGAMSVRSSRATGQTMAAISVAQEYANAADDYARDHRGRYPGAPGSADWPDVDRGPSAEVLGEQRFYLRAVPEPVVDGTVSWTARGPVPQLAYRQLNGGSGYELTLTIEGRPPCAFRGGNDAGGSDAVPCSRR